MVNGMWMLEMLANSIFECDRNTHSRTVLSTNNIFTPSYGNDNQIIS